MFFVVIQPITWHLPQRFNVQWRLILFATTHSLFHTRFRQPLRHFYSFMEPNYQEQLLVLISTPIYVLVIGFEMLWSHLHRLHHYDTRETLTNLYLMLLNMALDLGMRAVSIFFLFWAFQNAPYSHWDDSAPLYWILLMLSIDFMYYWLHRTDHFCRLFWAVHVTHHSSPKINLSTGFRSSVFEPLYRFAFYLPIAFLGFKVVDILFMHSALQIYGILVHTPHLKKGTFGFLEKILVMPSHHRVHHASNTIYLDKNLSMTFIFWDKMFGTFQEELDEVPPVYGLTKPVEDRSPVNIVLHEWKDIWKDVKRPGLTWQQRVGYLLRPPGWSHQHDDPHTK